MFAGRHAFARAALPLYDGDGGTDSSPRVSPQPYADSLKHSKLSAKTPEPLPVALMVRAAYRDPGISRGPLMTESQPLIAVRDVRASSRWYSELLGADSLPDHSHRDVYDRIWRSDRMLLQLHAWDEEDHPNLVNADAAPVGHGVVLWFQVDDFDSAVQRAHRLRAEVILEPHVNPAPQHREMWLRDPDGYVVVISSPDGESGG